MKSATNPGLTILSEHFATEEWRGVAEIVQKSLAVLNSVKVCYDLCVDSTGPKTILTQNQIREAYLAMKARGVRIRIITEVLEANIHDTKAVMLFADVRHLEAINGNFVVADTTDYAGAPEAIDGILAKLLVSNVPAFVRQQQYFFDTLWGKAMPAELRISQLEDGTEPEVTEIITGWEGIVKRTLDGFAKAKERVDHCCDPLIPPRFVQSPAYGATFDFVARGGRIRLITEITPDNLSSIKELMKTQEIRHIAGFNLNFGVSDALYTAPTSVYSVTAEPQCIYSNSKALIREHRYLFETLWEKGLPAEQRIMEIEGGIEPEKIELIRDTRQSIALASEIMKNTQKELLILFASPRTFLLGYSLGSVAAYGEMTKRGVTVRLLVPKGSQIENEVEKIKDAYPSIDMRVSNTDLITNITILVSDRKSFINWQLKDDRLSDPYEAGGIATYSNMESLASSYATIFDNLWKITEFNERLEMANVKLQQNENSMKEFIDIAAHELRTPVQPIIGLAQVLREKATDNEQSELLDAIIRNASRLKQLQENILDVTKIENQLVRYDKVTFAIDTLIEQLMKDDEKSHDGQERPAIEIALEPNCIVRADKQRIAQVILNLLSNSLKFTNKSGGIIRIGCHERENDVFVTFTDNGPGISPNIMSRLFTKFGTGTSSGTGLGLYISKRIVEDHGGRIWGENNATGEGATFTFTLPLARVKTLLDPAGI